MALSCQALDGSWPVPMLFLVLRDVLMPILLRGRALSETDVRTGLSELLFLSVFLLLRRHMKVRWVMFSEIYIDDNSVKPAYLRHKLLLTGYQFR
jgi:hypothetical protein